MNPKLDTLDDLRAALAEQFPGRSIVCSRNLWQYQAPYIHPQGEDYRVHVLPSDTAAAIVVDSCPTPADALALIMAAHAKLRDKAPCSTCSGTGRVQP